MAPESSGWSPAAPNESPPQTRLAVLLLLLPLGIALLLGFGWLALHGKGSSPPAKSTSKEAYQQPALPRGIPIATESKLPGSMAKGLHVYIYVAFSDRFAPKDSDFYQTARRGYGTSPRVYFLAGTMWEKPLPARMECRLDGGAWKPCRSPVQLQGLSTGEHHFRVRGTTPRGQQAEANWGWWAQRPRPQCTRAATDIKACWGRD